LIYWDHIRQTFSFSNIFKHQTERIQTRKLKQYQQFPWLVKRGPKEVSFFILS